MCKQAEPERIWGQGIDKVGLRERLVGEAVGSQVEIWELGGLYARGRRLGCILWTLGSH